MQVLHDNKLNAAGEGKCSLCRCVALSKCRPLLLVVVTPPLGMMKSFWTKCRVPIMAEISPQLQLLMKQDTSGVIANNNTFQDHTRFEQRFNAVMRFVDFSAYIWSSTTCSRSRERGRQKKSERRVYQLHATFLPTEPQLG